MEDNRPGYLHSTEEGDQIQADLRVVCSTNAHAHELRSYTWTYTRACAHTLLLRQGRETTPIVALYYQCQNSVSAIWFVELILNYVYVDVRNIGQIQQLA